MPNTTNKDYTKYIQRQLFNLIHQLERKIKKMQNDRVSFKEKMAKELEKKDKGFHNKLEELNKILQEINRRANDCCFGHEIPNIETQQAMRDVLNGENLETIEDFSAWANEIKKEVNAEN
ncbi:hypothetical protein [Helicobacter pylori]|uniref:hypothetical protein n=1 Tax=Helicobacter pylori TaxID=210 RepID=UPI000D3CF6BA|nr:hypothetical protein [Helicobacter pylori]MCQ2878735.1 hypothetical protein [Helicobacter pylori]PUD11521.1 hypothetical protein C2R90_01075 [Helicobacter pylori]